MQLRKRRIRGGEARRLLQKKGCFYEGWKSFDAVKTENVKFCATTSVFSKQIGKRSFLTHNPKERKAQYQRGDDGEKNDDRFGIIVFGGFFAISL